jgi:alkyl hydroperoxide reductase subunit AhpF
MQMQLLDREIIDQITKLFDSQLLNPIDLIHFISKDNCITCDASRQLLEEVSSISDKISLHPYDIHKESSLAQKYNIQYTPGLVVAGHEGDELLDYGIRLIGTPSGYEFSSLLQAIVMVSKRDSGLKTIIREQLSTVKEPVHLQVFVTPT